MARAGRSGPLLSYVHTALFLGKDLSNWLRLCPSFSLGLKIFTYLINLLFLTALGPRCYPGFSLVVVSGGYSLAGMHRLLIVVASLVVEHRFKSMWTQ